MPDAPGQRDELAWAPVDRQPILALRAALLGDLAEHPDQAPVEDTLVDRLAWVLPAVLSRPLSGPVDGMPFTVDEHGDVTTSSASPEVETFLTGGFPVELCEECLPARERAARAITGQLAEASFLGVVADGALSPLGRALCEQVPVQELAAELEKLLGAAQEEVVLQADLTATVLGAPSGRLITTLDQLAVREGRSAATVWRFSAASVRAALDAGWEADQVLAEPTEISRVAVPQPLTYLVRDVARAHGNVRGGGCAAYLRSADEALLA